MVVLDPEERADEELVEKVREEVVTVEFMNWLELLDCILGGIDDLGEVQALVELTVDTEPPNGGAELLIGAEARTDTTPDDALAETGPPVDKGVCDTVVKTALTDDDLVTPEL